MSSATEIKSKSKVGILKNQLFSFPFLDLYFIIIINFSVTAFYNIQSNSPHPGASYPFECLKDDALGNSGTWVLLNIMQV